MKNLRIDMNLPIGIQTFSQMVKNYYYVDKTKFIYELANGNSKYYFLSRPRRFGKSLLISTMKEFYLGNKELFKNLYVYDKWDWNNKYPVIHISFGAGKITNEKAIIDKLNEILENISTNEKISSNYTTISGKFADYVKKLYEKYNRKVVILVDEYDKPILDTIENPDICSQVRDELKNFYSVIKDSDEFVRFCFLTGVSKFLKVSVFSGLNNLKDITLSTQYSDICGYTQYDLETVFKDRFNKLSDEEKEQVKKWYNGYSWTGESVYNPFDILLYFSENLIDSYWFETGTPEFLIKLLLEKEYNIPNLENISASSILLNNFDINNIEIIPLFFQTGYLTIKERYQLGGKISYKLKIPNIEVKQALTNTILYKYVKDVDSAERNFQILNDYLTNNNIDKMKDLFHSFYASIPNEWYRKNNLSNYEGYYASIFYSYFTALGYNVIAEDTTNKGKIDMTVLFDNKCFILEFKVNEYIGEGNALQQIKDKKYYEKYQNRKDVNEIFLIGVEFSKDERNITNYQWEKI